MWSAEPPPSAHNAIQVVLTHLRKTLPGPPAAQVTRYGYGYRLEIDPNAVDACRFRLLVKRARGMRDARPAVAALDEALALWRGSALADAADTARAGQIRLGMLGEQLSAVEDWADAMLRCGRHPEVVDQLSGPLAEHPLREDLTRMQMLALYRRGRDRPTRWPCFVARVSGSATISGSSPAQNSSSCTSGSSARTQAWQRRRALQPETLSHRSPAEPKQVILLRSCRAPAGSRSEVHDFHADLADRQRTGMRNPGQDLELGPERDPVPGSAKDAGGYRGKGGQDPKRGAPDEAGPRGTAGPGRR